MAAPAMSERVGYAVMHKGEALQPWRFQVPTEPGDQEIDIRVTVRCRSTATLHAALTARVSQHNGLCHTDIHMRDDDWHISGFPFVPGHEVVGVVIAAGAGVHAACARVGQRCVPVRDKAARLRLC
jgi:uncharacterized zinc-type alcohol dehydrogenase-like protein